MTDRITVQVRADDPVSEAGVTGLLRPFPEIRLHNGPDAAAVTVVTTDAFDPAGYQLLRTVQQSSPSRLVLLVPRLQDHQVGLVAECGIASIMWRTDATAPRLIQVIQAEASGDGHLPPDLQKRGRLLRLVGRLHGDRDPAADLRRIRHLGHRPQAQLLGTHDQERSARRHEPPPAVQPGPRRGLRHPQRPDLTRPPQNHQGLS